MEYFSIEDVTGDEVDVRLIASYSGTIKTAVALDFNPYELDEVISVMYYTPDKARKLATALIQAADEAEKL